MDQYMKLYYDYTTSPLGQVFYKTVWHQLGDIESQKVLDFGSGFGYTSNFLAAKNEVVAVELDEVMIDNSLNDTGYEQIQGGLNALKQFEDESFDVVIFHLVLEFVEEKEAFLSEVLRVLKKGGTLSIVRHNRLGRVIQAVVQDYDLNDAKKLLQGEPSFSSAFGHINYYENDDILTWTHRKVDVDAVYGVRALASLHDASMQSKENWQQEMFEMELELLKKSEIVNIAYFNHLRCIKK